MNRVEATIFAASEPVTRSVLARVVGASCNLDLLIDDLREELRGRPYDLVAVASGFRHLTRPAYADAIRSAFGMAIGGNERAADLTQSEVLVLMCIAYFQPITRGELSSFFGKEISRDLIGHLRRRPDCLRSAQPTPGAPYTYVTTKEFLLEFGFDTLRDLPDIEALEDAGLLSREKLLAGDITSSRTCGQEDIRVEMDEWLRRIRAPAGTPASGLALFKHLRLARLTQNPLATPPNLRSTRFSVDYGIMPMWCRFGIVDRNDYFS
ncbi:SMC-Scp complex subunit ScpB [Mesorhizobium sp. M0663]|uniref:SMC-Scp complex subunit ScpB n=1 Tax=Mesorhizobium sp. M0663 TaxID=2956981 RepID=UPI003339CDE9